MKKGNLKVIVLALLLVAGVTMTSGCLTNVGQYIGLDDNNEDAVDQYYKNNTTKNNDTVESDNTDKSSDQSSETKKTTTTTTTTKKTSTPTKTESCSHPSVTTKYVGLDKATGKVIYDTYCSKCGEYLGRVLY